MIGVITGDIINSRKYKNQEIWLDSLKPILNKWGETPKVWEIYRGDSFQLEISKPECTFGEAIKIKSCIKSLEKGLDVRIGIGIGEKTYNGERITESNGEAFINSGDAFEKINKSKKGLSIMTPWNDLNESFEIIIGLASLIIDKWTIVSAEVINKSLDHPTLTQSDIAKLLQIKSQPEISQVRKRAGYDEIKAAIDYFEEIIKGRN